MAVTRGSRAVCLGLFSVRRPRAMMDEGLEGHHYMTTCARVAKMSCLILDALAGFLTCQTLRNKKA